MSNIADLKNIFFSSAKFTTQTKTIKGQQYSCIDYAYPLITH